MTTISPSDTKMRQRWSPERQQQYRATHQTLMFHFLLDSSPSMCGQDEVNLRRAFNMYLAWLQHHADPMSLVEVRCFSTPLDPGTPVPLGMLKPLTGRTYNPALHGSGTALYRAVGETCTVASGAATPVQHIVIVFTDGADNTSEEVGWTNGQVSTLLQTLQEQQHWLAIFLGAIPDALEVGKSMGFQPGNCLTFATDQIPDAFGRLLHATQRYLAASPQERKLLAATGVF
jgi:hypothetical protein